MSTPKHFSDIQIIEKNPEIGFSDEFLFTMKDVTVSIAIANCIRRIIGLDIPTFTISPETINYQINTSPWDPEMITHQLVYIPMIPDFLRKSDLNMLELILDVTNDEKAYRYVLSNELILKNKETNKIISNEILVYKNIPLFLLGPKQHVKLSCKIEYMTKKESDSRHQAGTAGIDYKQDEKIDTDPVEILFNVNIQTGLSSKDLISLVFDNLISRFKKLQETIKKGDSSSFYMQLNRYHRYDFVFIGEDHTIGNLIEKWNNRHDSRSVTGYRQPSDGKSIKIDYGLDKFAPVIFTQNDGGDDDKLENLIEKSIISIDEKKEKQQRIDTLKIFIENLLRIEEYLIELKDDWEKVKIINVPVKEYMNSIFKQRIERLQR